MKFQRSNTRTFTYTILNENNQRSTSQKLLRVDENTLAIQKQLKANPQPGVS